MSNGLSGINWGKTSNNVEIYGVNAVILIPFIIYMINISSIKLFILFLMSIFIIFYFENILKLKIIYVPYAIRYKITGSVKSPKSKRFDY